MSTLEKRIKEYKEQVEKEYAFLSSHSWREGGESYILTEMLAGKNSNTTYFGESVVIRNDSWSPMLFCIMGAGAMIVWYVLADENIYRVLSVILGAGLVFFCLRAALDRRNKLRLTAFGIWFHEWGENIEWKSIIITCIKRVSDDESVSYFLVVHYYDEHQDAFNKKEIALAGLEVSSFEISNMVEVFRSRYPLHLG